MTKIRLAPPSNFAPVFNVKAYGAKGDGVTDDTAAIQAALTAAGAAGAGVVWCPDGTYSVAGPSSGIFTVTGNVSVEGPGTIQIAAGSVTTSGTLFNLSGASSFGFDRITLDGQGSTQNWAASGDNDYFKAISADANNGTTNNASLRIGSITVKNFSMSSTVKNGIVVDTFGTSVWDIDDIFSDACDYTLFITQAFATTPNAGTFRRIVAHNPNNATVLDEGGLAGPGWQGGQVLVYLDSLCGSSQPADGVRTSQGAASKYINLDELIVVNGRYPITVQGNGLSDAHFGKCIAVGCRGSFDLRSADGSCSFEQLTADGCAIGGITGATVFASFEIGNVAGDAANIGMLICNNSQTQAIQGFGGPVRINGGRIKNGTTTVNVDTPAGSSIRNVEGYNPVGLVTVAVPTSGTAVTAAPYDRTFHITASTSTVACAVTDAAGTSQTVATIPASGFGSVTVPAGSTLTPTYTAAPTWTVQGL